MSQKPRKPRSTPEPKPPVPRRSKAPIPPPGAALIRPDAEMPGHERGTTPHLTSPTRGEERSRLHTAPANSVLIPNTQNLTPVRMRWEGEFWFWHSLAHVNREICVRLARRLGIELSIAPTGPAEFGPEVEPRFGLLEEITLRTLSGPGQIHVRHVYPPRLNKAIEGLFVLIFAWEYGYLPRVTIEDIIENVAECWCYSEPIRQTYIASGIPEDRLFVIPLGADPQVFRPDAPPYVFTTELGAHRMAGFDEPPFVFLFCGGTLDRKGADVLYDAIINTFAPGENVLFVIKDFCTNTVYQSGNLADRFRALAVDKTRPAVIYMDRNMTAAELASLYTAAHVIVAPYRAEGFNLSVLEGMCAGRAVITTKGGPTDMFVDETVGWLIDSERKPYGSGRIGDWVCCGETWWLEPNGKSLGRAMREAFNNPEEARKRGEAGARRVRESYTWDHTADKIVARLEVLAERAPENESRRDALFPLQPLSSVGAAENTAQRGKSEAPDAEHPTPDLEPPSPVPSPKGRGANRPSPQATPDAERQTPNHHPHRASPIKGEDQMRSTPEAERQTPILRPAGYIRKRPTVCLFMIVKNEQRVMANCLKTARDADFADHIVIADTGSTDRTVAICKKYGAYVFSIPFNDSFGASRQASMDMANEVYHPDILVWIDADDTVPLHCGPLLRQSVFTMEAQTMGMLMQVHIPSRPGEHGDTHVDHCKVIRGGHPEFKWRFRIHEQIMESIKENGGRIERSEAYVVHSGYDYSPEGQAAKRAREDVHLALDLLENPSHPFPRWNAGMTAFHRGQFPLAVQMLEECLTLSTNAESTEHQCYSMIGTAHMELRNMDKAREYLDKGLAMYPNDTSMLFNSARLYRDLGDLAAAERLYHRLLAPRPAHDLDSLDVSMSTYKCLFNLGTLYMATGRPAEAERSLRAAVDHYPGFTPGWQMLATLYKQTGRFEDAKAAEAKAAELGAPVPLPQGEAR